MLAAVVADIRHCLGGAELLHVGAAARDLLVVQIHGVDTRRRTHDLDFAFAIPDWAAYEKLRGCLTTSRDYTPDPHTEHRFRAASAIPIDLIPFDGVEDRNADIGWPPDEAELMSVLGYREAALCCLDVLLPGAQTLQIPSLPMQVLLKLLAWSDRHHRAPRKDADDLMFLLGQGLTIIGFDRLHDTKPDLLDDPDFDYDLAAAWLVGHELRSCLEDVSERLPLLLERANAILTAETDPEGPLRLIGELQSAVPDAERRRLIAFRRGLLRLAHSPFDP